MIFPIGDTPNPRGYLAWVTWALIAVNVVVYVLWTLPLSFQPLDPSDPAARQLLVELSRRFDVHPRMLLDAVSAWDLAVSEWGYKPGAPEVRDLFASLFLHAGFAHLAGNMLFLWIYGDNVEHRLGHAVFLLTYVGGGVAATVFFALFASGSLVPLVGASGAISAVLGAYLLFFPRNRVRLLVFLGFFVDVFLVPAPLVLGAYLVVENLLPFLFRAGGGVAYGAHIGGFLAGLAVAGVVRSAGLGLPREAGAPVPDESDPVALARRLADEGRPRAALDVALAALRSERSPERAAALHLVAAGVLERWNQVSLAYQHAAAVLRITAHPGLRGEARAILERLLGDPRLVDKLPR